MTDFLQSCFEQAAVERRVLDLKLREQGKPAILMVTVLRFFVWTGLTLPKKIEITKTPIRFSLEAASVEGGDPHWTLPGHNRLETIVTSP
jgi:hypothetical protein